MEKTIGIQIIHGASHQTQFAMAAFSDLMVTSEPFTAGAAAVTKKISALDNIANGIPKKDRKTSIFGAVKEGVSMFGKTRPGDVICLITDGGENHSQTPKQQVEQFLLANGIRAYAILLVTSDEDLGPPGVVAASRESVMEMTRVSGGMTYLPRRELYPGQAARYLRSVADFCLKLDLQLEKGYLTRVRATVPRKPEHWKLEVVGQDGKVDHRLSVFYPRLSPCSAKP